MICGDASNLLPVYDMEGEEHFHLHFVGDANNPSKEFNSTSGPFDGLLIDRYGVFTILEVKRSTDARMRREVIAQIMDYGSAFTNLSLEQICEGIAKMRDLDLEFSEGATFNADPTVDEWYSALFLGGKPVGDQDRKRCNEFKSKIELNLAKGFVRLVLAVEKTNQSLIDMAQFAMRGVPPHVLGICELSIEKMDGSYFFVPHLKFSSPRFPAEVYRYHSKANSCGTNVWDTDSFYLQLKEHFGTDSAEYRCFKKVDKFLTEARFSKSFGRGVTASICFKPLNYSQNILYLFANGTIQFNMDPAIHGRRLRHHLEQLEMSLLSISSNFKVGGNTYKSIRGTSLMLLLEEQPWKNFCKFTGEFVGVLESLGMKTA